jgi:hypothetical protein
MKKYKIAEIYTFDANSMLKELNTTLQKEGLEVISICPRSNCPDRVHEDGFDLIDVNIDTAHGFYFIRM